MYAFKVSILTPLSITCFTCCQGKYQGHDYAIFQGQHYNLSEVDNASDLRNELNLLALTDYFLCSFSKCVECKKLVIPGACDQDPSLRVNSDIEPRYTL